MPSPDISLVPSPSEASRYNEQDTAEQIIRLTGALANTDSLSAAPSLSVWEDSTETDSRTVNTRAYHIVSSEEDEVAIISVHREAGLRETELHIVAIKPATGASSLMGRLTTNHYVNPKKEKELTIPEIRRRAARTIRAAQTNTTA